MDKGSGTKDRGLWAGQGAQWKQSEIGSQCFSTKLDLDGCTQWVTWSRIALLALTFAWCIRVCLCVHTHACHADNQD